MADESFPINNLLAIAKSREIQRAMLDEMRGERSKAAPHFLAGAHMELVLADDYDAAGEEELALRSRLSAASCFWRAGQVKEAQALFALLRESLPQRVAEIDQVSANLAHDYPLAS